MCSSLHKSRRISGKAGGSILGNPLGAEKKKKTESLQGCLSVLSPPVVILIYMEC